MESTATNIQETNGLRFTKIIEEYLSILFSQKVEAYTRFSEFGFVVSEFVPSNGGLCLSLRYSHKEVENILTYQGDFLESISDFIERENPGVKLNKIAKS